MDFSFIIASNRNVNDYLFRVIDSINNRSNNKFSHEIIVSHPSEDIDRRANTTYIKDNDLVGPLPAFNHIIKMATGDTIISLSDGVEIAVGFDYWADIMNGEEMMGRSIKVGGNGHGCSPAAPHVNGGCTIRWPFLARETLYNHLNGMLWNPNFSYHCGDNWLGAWTYLMGEPAREYSHQNSLIDIPHPYNDRYDHHDRNVLAKLCGNFEINRSYTAAI